MEFFTPHQDGKAGLDELSIAVEIGGPLVNLLDDAGEPDSSTFYIKLAIHSFSLHFSFILRLYSFLRSFFLSRRGSSRDSSSSMLTWMLLRIEECVLFRRGASCAGGLKLVQQAVVEGRSGRGWLLGV